MQHDVVGEVAGTFSDKILVAGLDCLLRRGSVAPIGEVDERGGAAEQRRAAHLLGTGGDERRAVRLDPHMVQMHMRVDAARHNDVSGRVDHALGFGRERASRSDRGDGFAADRDIATHNALRRHHVAAANDEIEHRSSPVARDRALPSNRGFARRSPRNDACAR